MWHRRDRTEAISADQGSSGRPAAGRGRAIAAALRSVRRGRNGWNDAGGACRSCVGQGGAGAAHGWTQSLSVNARPGARAPEAHGGWRAQATNAGTRSGYAGFGARRQRGVPAGVGSRDVRGRPVPGPPEMKKAAGALRPEVPFSRREPRRPEFAPGPGAGARRAARRTRPAGGNTRRGVLAESSGVSPRSQLRPPRGGMSGQTPSSRDAAKSQPRERSGPLTGSERGHVHGPQEAAGNP